MKGEVHIPIGLATAGALSLIVPAMQPNSFHAAVIVAVCGAVGALTPDIDANGDSKMKQEFRKIMSLIALAVAIGIWYEKPLNILVDLVWWKTAGLVLLVGCYIYGYSTKHRGFTHELRGLIVFCIPVFLLLDVRNGMWFFAGMLSHQLADMCNYERIYWLNPVDSETNFSRKWFRSSSVWSQLIGMGAWIVVYGVFRMYMNW